MIRPRFPSPIPIRSTATGTARTSRARPRASASSPTAQPTRALTTRTTYSNSFRIGPGVAPKADLYAVRVFGCFGSTNVVVEALDWAVDHDMDVVNMSLGSDYGTSDSADALASDNAAKAGIVVVASSGNSRRPPLRHCYAGLEQPFHFGGGNRNHRHFPDSEHGASSCWRRSGKDHCGNQRQRGSVRKPFQRNGEGRAGRSAARRRQPRLQRRRIQCERAGSRQDCRGAARHLRPCSPRRFSVSKRAQSRSS